MNATSPVVQSQSTAPDEEQIIVAAELRLCEVSETTFKILEDLNLGFSLSEMTKRNRATSESAFRSTLQGALKRLQLGLIDCEDPKTIRRLNLVFMRQVQLEAHKDEKRVAGAAYAIVDLSPEDNEILASLHRGAKPEQLLLRAVCRKIGIAVPADGLDTLYDLARRSYELYLSILAGDDGVQKVTQRPVQQPTEALLAQKPAEKKTNVVPAAPAAKTDPATTPPQPAQAPAPKPAPTVVEEEVTLEEMLSEWTAATASAMRAEKCSDDVVRILRAFATTNNLAKAADSLGYELLALRAVRTVLYDRFVPKGVKSDHQAEVLTLAAREVFGVEPEAEVVSDVLDATNVEDAVAGEVVELAHDEPAHEDESPAETLEPALGDVTEVEGHVAAEAAAPAASLELAQGGLVATETTPAEAVVKEMSPAADEAGAAPTDEPSAWTKAAVDKMRKATIHKKDVKVLRAFAETEDLTVAGFELQLGQAELRSIRTRMQDQFVPANVPSDRKAEVLTLAARELYSPKPKAGTTSEVSGAAPAEVAKVAEPTHHEPALEGETAATVAEPVLAKVVEEVVTPEPAATPDAEPVEALGHDKDGNDGRSDEVQANSTTIDTHVGRIALMIKGAIEAGTLTPKQREFLQLHAEGNSIKQIAEKTGRNVSALTVAFCNFYTAYKFPPLTSDEKRELLRRATRRVFGIDQYASSTAVPAAGVEEPVLGPVQAEPVVETPPVEPSPEAANGSDAASPKKVWVTPEVIVASMSEAALEPATTNLADLGEAFGPPKPNGNGETSVPPESKEPPAEAIETPVLDHEAGDDVADVLGEAIPPSALETSGGSDEVQKPAKPRKGVSGRPKAVPTEETPPKPTPAAPSPLPLSADDLWLTPEIDHAVPRMRKARFTQDADAFLQLLAKASDLDEAALAAGMTISQYRRECNKFALQLGAKSWIGARERLVIVHHAARLVYGVTPETEAAVQPAVPVEAEHEPPVEAAAPDAASNPAAKGTDNSTPVVTEAAVTPVEAVLEEPLAVIEPVEAEEGEGETLDVVEPEVVTTPDAVTRDDAKEPNVVQPAPVAIRTPSEAEAFIRERVQVLTIERSLQGSTLGDFLESLLSQEAPLSVDDVFAAARALGCNLDELYRGFKGYDPDQAAREAEQARGRMRALIAQHVELIKQAAESI